MLFWFGLLGVFLLLLLPSPSWNWTYYRISDAVITLGYLAVLAGTGLLYRRAATVVPGVVLLVLAGALLLLPDITNQFGGFDFANVDLINTVAFALLFAAYLAVRRVAPAAWALLVPAAGLEYLWVAYVTRKAFFGTGATPDFVVRLYWPVTFVGGTALLALAALLAHRIAAGAAALPGAPAPGPWDPPPIATPAGWTGAGAVPAVAPAAAAPVSGWTVAPGGPAVAPWGHGGYPLPQQRTNTLAVVALVLGIVGVNLGGIICGHIALSQIRRTGEGGRGMAIAGLVLGYVWVAVVVLLLIVAGVLASSSPY